MNLELPLSFVHEEPGFEKDPLAQKEETTLP